MSKKKPNDALSRSDAVLIAALAIILATASAAIGSAMTYNPSTDRPAMFAVRKPVPVQVIAAKTGPRRDFRRTAGRASLPVGSPLL